MVDRLDSMAVLVKVAELGSFTKAGAALNLSPQMVGRHIAELEARMDTELVRRTTRRQSLTAVGAIFLQRCRAILAEVAAAETLAHDLGTTPRGRLRVSAPVYLGGLHLAPVIGTFLRDFPKVEVDLVLEDRYVDLVEEGYDLALRLGRLADSSLHARALAPHRLIACAAPAYLARRGTPETPADLVDHACLEFVYSTGAAMSEWRFDRAGRSVTVEIGSRLSCNDSRVLLDAALSGDGIVLQGERTVHDDLEAGRLIRVLPDWQGPERPLHLLYSASRLQTLKLRAFVDHVARALGPS